MRARQLIFAVLLPLFAVALPGPIRAQSGNPELDENCQMAGMMAGVTMHMRQNGYAMDGLLEELERIKDDLGTDGVTAIRAQVREAYRGPRFENAERKRAAVVAFEDAARRKCLTQR